MGIPLYRERSAVAVSPQVKLPLVCPYPASTANVPRSHHHHHNVPAGHSQTNVEVHTLVPRHERGPNGDVWRQTTRSYVTRDRPSDRPAESSERSTASASRYVSRIVRSQPGTREHDDELRAAELVELYFQELSRIRAASTNTENAEPTEEAETSRARAASERALDMVARRQRRLEASQALPVVMDRRSMHETLMRAHQQAMRVPYPAPADQNLAEHMATLDQDMQETSDDGWSTSARAESRML